jgi:hypothetical protein
MLLMLVVGWTATFATEAASLRIVGSSVFQSRPSPSPRGEDRPTLPSRDVRPFLLAYI